MGMASGIEGVPWCLIVLSRCNCNTCNKVISLRSNDLLKTWANRLSQCFKGEKEEEKKKWFSTFLEEL